MSSATASIEVDLIYSPIVNFAMQQNHVPVIRKLTIKNPGDVSLNGLLVEISAEPDFAVLWKKHIDLSPYTLADLGPVDIKFNTAYLVELTERITGNFTLIIKSGEEILFKELYNIGILPYDYWNGTTTLPEMLAAFVTPNHPEIAKIIISASAILQKWTGRPSFDAYQSLNPDRARKQMAAIYEAIAELNLVYNTVPASFEETGQRVRMCDTIFMQNMANCLDISLLFASCLEAVGLRPLIIVIKGHAFAGGWLIDESFPDSVNDDLSLLTKRTADGINEIVLVESTLMNAGNISGFDDAVREANQKLLNEEDFLLFIDVRRARFGSIRPLPLRVKTIHGWELVSPHQQDRNNSIPEEILPAAKLVDAEKIEVSKVQLWERKLLDLTLRNNLLNLRITKNTVQLIFTQLHKLEDSLAAGAEFQILPKPTDWDNPLRNAGVYQAINAADPVTDLVNHEFTQKRLRSYLTENELSASITNLFRSSRLSLEENGANTLYISFGVLKWFETPESERARYAPILLMPVEIVRRSALKGYLVRTREEETMMNITLLEMLRQDFGINIGGLENLPKDETGVDLRSVFSIIRQGIMTKPGWEVEEQVFLGIFSFSKFIMWNDIHRNAAKLLQNKFVSSLVSGRIEWDVTDDETNSSNDFDDKHHPATIALPISADSSQLEAITASMNNKSFVLHGPPGTGKSQTITNIISNALYNGKRVLFVAEKMAALSVVRDRLEKIGLGPFCLELHSNKSKKSAVLEQLKRTIGISKLSSPESYRVEAERIHLLRNELNAYVNALHKKYPFGFSLFDCFSYDAQLQGITAEIIFNHQQLETLSSADVTNWNDIVEELQAAGSLLPSPVKHPLRYVNVQVYTQQLKAEAKELLVVYLDHLKNYQTYCAEVCTKQLIDTPVNSKDQFDALNNIAQLLLTITDIPTALVSAENLEQVCVQLIAISGHGIKRNELRNDLMQHFQKSILVFDAEFALSNWNAAEGKWFLPKFFQQGAIKKRLKKISTGGSIEHAGVVPILQKIINYQQEQELIEQNKSVLSSWLGFLWNGDDCNWQQLVITANTLIHINRAIIFVTGSTVKARLWRNHIANELGEGATGFVAVHGKYLKDFTSSHQSINVVQRKLSALLGIDFPNLLTAEGNCLSHQQTVFSTMLSGIEQLKNWVSWINAKDKAMQDGLFPVIKAYETGSIESEQLTNIYKKSLYRSCAAYIIQKEPALASFNGKLFEEKIRRFRLMSHQYEKLTKDELFAKLASRVPDFTRESSQSSEISVLQKTIRNNGRAMPIRKLFDAIPNLLPRIAPCMLMSPISVAQYFDVTVANFDLVVFDEASQMPTCEAVGAIARADNMIVVGDPKQMPPTSFFTSSSNIDEDNIEKEDLESILDDCLALSMPSRHLLWHYRSKHESLIAFSNSRYYENKLLTFPSPDDIATKVSFIPVAGYYDRGKSRQNSFEAKAVIEELRRRLSDPVLSKKSIGVVTFSAVQQLLVQNLFDDLLKTYPELEAVALDTHEPIFIKNLENVQGDERDIILFSVGYGPDQAGKLSLNFGPLNREGGWRRLNVAVSRARYEMRVYSTLRADDIDITRSSSEGVAGIRSFLEYAEKGRVSLVNKKMDIGPTDTGFEKLLAEKIRLAGYDVHTNVGCSGYRIDLGIVNKQKSSEYILGILCDGNNYKNAKTARDREIIQYDVLKQLGWQLFRVWSTDWWENPEEVMSGIMAAIQQAELNIEVVTEEEEPALRVSENNEQVFLNGGLTRLAEKRTIFSNEYKVCSLELSLTSTSEDFLQLHNQQKIKSQITKVVETEAPITRNLLVRRVLAAWGISKLGTRINAQFEQYLLELNFIQTGEKENPVFWNNEVSAEIYSAYRVSTVNGQKRDAEDIPVEEIANGIREILRHQLSLPKEELIREGAKLFGFARSGSNVEMAMKRGIEKALLNGTIIEKDQRVIFKENSDTPKFPSKK